MRVSIRRCCSEDSYERKSATAGLPGRSHARWPARSRLAARTLSNVTLVQQLMSSQLSRERRTNTRDSERTNSNNSREDRRISHALDSRMNDVVNVASERNALKPWYIVDPNSLIMSCWDVVAALALFFTALVTPFEVGFLPGPTRADEPLFVLNRIVDAIFLCDMGLNFLMMYRVTPTKDDDRLWEHRLPMIARHYLRGWFGLDVVSILPAVFDILPLLQHTSEKSASPFKSIRVLRALRLIKLMRLVRSSRLMKRAFSKASISYGVRASHHISSHHISSHLITSHHISSHHISSHLITSHLISSHLVSSDLI
jgi:hypothetical protein